MGTWAIFQLYLAIDFNFVIHYHHCKQATIIKRYNLQSKSGQFTCRVDVVCFWSYFCYDTFMFFFPMLLIIIILLIALIFVILFNKNAKVNRANWLRWYSSRSRPFYIWQSCSYVLLFFLSLLSRQYFKNVS